jgi:xanthine dehydrogenase accessory factor
MNGPLALVHRCLLDEVPVALATVVELNLETRSTEILPDLGSEIAMEANSDSVGAMGSPELTHVVVRDMLGALGTGRSTTRHYGPHGEAGRNDVTVFIQVFASPARMLIFGAVDFTAALVRVAKVLGYHVTVCDARPAFATDIRFPEADEVVADWPHRYLAMQTAGLGPMDAICVLTHDHKFDIPVLVAGLNTDVGYLGAMGSRSTHERRVKLLIEEGVNAERIHRIMSPIGIDIGARTPEETAVSICAEIIALRSGAPALSLRDSSGPIHRVVP